MQELHFLLECQKAAQNRGMKGNKDDKGYKDNKDNKDIKKRLAQIKNMEKEKKAR